MAWMPFRSPGFHESEGSGCSWRGAGECADGIWPQDLGCSCQTSLRGAGFGAFAGWRTVLVLTQVEWSARMRPAAQRTEFYVSRTSVSGAPVAAGYRRALRQEGGTPFRRPHGGRQRACSPSLCKA